MKRILKDLDVSSRWENFHRFHYGLNFHKLIWYPLQSEVESAIKSLVSSAVVDPNVKGGLIWPLGKESVGESERFSIVGAWHTNYKAFRNETMRLKLRHADRFDHRSSTGEVANEVTFQLFSMSRRLEVSKMYSNGNLILLFCWSKLLLCYSSLFVMLIFCWWLKPIIHMHYSRNNFKRLEGKARISVHFTCRSITIIIVLQLGLP
jgi:hypothetical protein